ncbi:hypothetical protein [Salinimicrobium flavum]|uniref:Uncharacterized protein n=1 Tax=Salinimicrobium flavum TaxID=1737065 RepID=A0ABW5IRP5_9FLAO
MAPRHGSQIRVILQEIDGEFRFSDMDHRSVPAKWIATPSNEWPPPSGGGHCRSVAQGFSPTP